MNAEKTWDVQSGKPEKRPPEAKAKKKRVTPDPDQPKKPTRRFGKTKREIAAWREAGFPPLHHSEVFRKAYSPAYRVVLKRFGAQLMAVN